MLGQRVRGEHLRHIGLRRGDYVRIAVDRAAGGDENKFVHAVFPAVFEQVQQPHEIHVRIVDRVQHRVDDRRLRGKVDYKLRTFDFKYLRNFSIPYVLQIKRRIRPPGRQVLQLSRRQVVDYRHGMALALQQVYHCGADKTGAAGYEYFHV